MLLFSLDQVEEVDTPRKIPDDNRLTEDSNRGRGCIYGHDLDCAIISQVPKPNNLVVSSEEDAILIKSGQRADMVHTSVETENLGT